MVRVTVLNDTFNNISVEFSNNYCRPWEFFGFEEWGRKREECGCLMAPIYTVASSLMQRH